VSSSSVGSVLITLGIGLVVVGLLVSVGGFGWFASMIVISIALNLVFYIIRRFF